MYMARSDKQSFLGPDGCDVGFFCLLKQIERHASKRASQGEGSERTVEPVFGYHGCRGKRPFGYPLRRKKRNHPEETRNVVEPE
jgi:hypothetical protein